MTRNPNLSRLADWRKRLQRFEASGLTVARFCKRERVSINRFYYWTKQVREHPQQTPVEDLDGEFGGTATLDVSSATDAPIAKTPAKLGDMVHFSLNDNVQVSVPVECLEAVRCILQWSQDREAVGAGETNRSSRFQQVIAYTG